jgi:hypothetical protein
MSVIVVSVGSSSTNHGCGRPGAADIARGVVVVGHAVTMADGVGAERVPVFVSHAGPDVGWAEWVAWQLERAGHRVELAVWDWSAGEDFVARMRAAMDVPDVVLVALLSRAYFDPSRFSAAEWNAARAAVQADGFRVVPVRVEDVSVPVLERSLIRADLFGLDPAAARARLLAAVRGAARPEAEPAYPGAVATATDAGAGTGPRLPGVLPLVWRVPPRNAAFTGRDRMLADVRAGLSGGGRLALQALEGMGGVGKTSLAIEYAHRFAGDFEAVWWVDAENPGLIEEQYRELAVAARVADADVAVQAGAAAGRAWLRRESGWLVVFDNAEDPAPVLPMLPEGAGQVLVTSRDPRWRQIGSTSVASVAVFARGESVALLRTHLPAIADADADAVAVALGDLPLAVAQAGSFMAESGMTPTRYLDGLRGHLGEAMSEGKPAGYPRPLAAGVLLAVERVAGEDLAAVQLLRVAAFLAPEPIPATWIAAAAVAGVFEEPLAAVAASPFALPKALTRLARYGLVKLSAGGDPVLHRLTAAITRDTLDPDTRARERQRAEAVLVAADPGDTDHPRTWPVWTDLVPHLLALDPGGSDNPILRRLALNATWAMLARGDHHTGQQIANDLLVAWRARLGEDHPHTLAAATNLATAHRSQGDYSAARELDQDTLARRHRMLGEDDPAALVSANNLALALRELGEVEAARHLDEDTLARLRQALGEDHPATLTSASNLALDMSALGEREAAHELNDDTLARRRRALGEDHPDTLTSANNLAIDLYQLGDVAASRELNEDTLARRRRVLGEDHPNTLSSASNLAIDLRELGEVAAARKLNEDTLARRRRVLGEDHPDTLRSANNLALDLRKLEAQTGVEPQKLPDGNSSM